MPSTYDKIATASGTGSAGDITFTVIPSTYTDLVLVANIFTTANANTTIRLNGDTGSNYSATVLWGNGTTASSTRASNTDAVIYQQDLFSTSSISALSVFNFMNYSSSSVYKTVLVRSNKANQSTEAWVNLWRNTSAITSITVRGATFTTDAKFTLYGIKAA